MDKSKNKNGGSFKVTGNWSAWSKQLKDKFSKLGAADLKLEKPKEKIKMNTEDKP